MKLKDVSLSNIGEGDKKSTNGPAWLLCVPSVRWLLFSSTAVQLGDSFTVARTKQLQRTHAGLQQQASLPHVPVTQRPTSRAPHQLCPVRQNRHPNQLPDAGQPEYGSRMQERCTCYKKKVICASWILRCNILTLVCPLTAFPKHYHNLISWGLIVLTVKWPQVSPWPFHTHSTAAESASPLTLQQNCTDTQREKPSTHSTL